MTTRGLWMTVGNLLPRVRAIDSGNRQVMLIKKPASNLQKKVNECCHQGAGSGIGDTSAVRQLSDADLSPDPTSSPSDDLAPERTLHLGRPDLERLPSCRKPTAASKILSHELIGDPCGSTLSQSSVIA